MPAFFPEPVHQHGTPARTGVLLVNLGTPDAPTASALRRYLKQFLSDPRVVEIPKPIWWLILNGIILNIRPKKSAAKYASIWRPEGSPLRHFTEQQANGVAQRLQARGHADLLVRWAMRYGNPGIDQVLNDMKAAGCQRILLVPMYPQYSASTTATVLDVVCQWLSRTRNQPALRTLRNFHDDTGYLTALERSVRAHWQTYGPLQGEDKLIISFHGLPKRNLELGDPYFCECHKTGRLLAERLGLQAGQYMVCFQSRFGKAEWLQPYTAPTLETLARQGVDRVDVICPGFVADCLETLEEIALEGKADFLKAGGKTYHYIPALNDQADWLDALTDLCEQNLGGWLTPMANDGAVRQATLARAQALGAKS